MTDADWLAAVAAAPDDPLVRLAYADWLDDRGDPRADVVRLDVALFGQPLTDDRREHVRRLVEPLDPAWWVPVLRMPFTDPDDHGERWLVWDYCPCRRPDVAAGGLVATDRTLGHRLADVPRTPAEVGTLCRAAVACERQVIQYIGLDPVVIRQLGNDPGRSSHLLNARWHVVPAEQVPGVERWVVTPTRLPLTPTTPQTRPIRRRPAAWADPADGAAPLLGPPRDGQSWSDLLEEVGVAVLLAGAVVVVALAFFVWRHGFGRGP